MAEFVERALEQLVPVFEHIKLTQLMHSSELDDFIKQCRTFEYKCSKRTKQSKDFLSYAHYVAEQLDIIEQRRRRMKYMHRYDEIERPLKQKCAFIYRICTHRFRKLEYYNEEIAFLRRTNMFKNCSQAFTRLLQIHGHLASNYVRAARFEFFDNNHSAESARSILATGLRKFPNEVQLWLTHFEIELFYVDYILRRQQFLLTQSKAKREEAGGDHHFVPTVNDDVLNLKLARIVYELAMKNIQNNKDKTELLRGFLRIVSTCGDFAKSLELSLREDLEAIGITSLDLEGEDDDRIKADTDLFTIDTEGLEIKEGNAEKFEEQMKEEEPKVKKSSVLDGFDPDDPEIKEILAKAKLTEDYDKRPLEEVLAISIRQQKKQRKAKREGTAGSSWYSMPATELTDERRHDLEVVQMRDALEPNQHYKKPDREVLPKYFQVGHIIESKADFYSGRMPKKQRKRTLVEELMQDTELLARNKKRYSEIVRRNEITKRGAFQRRGALPKRSRRKKNKKSH